MIAWCIAAASAAELWWVPDPQKAESLRDALRTDWTESPVEVVVGGRPDEAFGWSWDGDTLAVRTAETQRIADADDAHVAVLFARTWNIRTETPGWEQWLPAGRATASAEAPDGTGSGGAETAASPITPSEEPLPTVVTRTPAPEVSDDERALPDDLDLPRGPVPAVRAQPDPNQTPWSLGIGLGARSMTQVPSVPSIQVPTELTVGWWVLAADFTADPSPWRMGNTSGLADGIEDLWSGTLRSGGRLQGRTWMSVSPGLQFRMAAPSLASDGAVIAQFTRPVMAGVIDVGVGQDLGFTRFALHTWLRASYTLPLSAGVDLQVLAFAHERRRWR